MTWLDYLVARLVSEAALEAEVRLGPLDLPAGFGELGDQLHVLAWPYKPEGWVFRPVFRQID